mmetsp:Transcript_24050/g.19782  ORF Transcript_24050/g.19782 Transcript_24050/m.19782 type:complete len:82 (+) Transcript_24050:61-306(+)
MRLPVQISASVRVHMNTQYRRISPDILQASGYSAVTSHTDKPKGKRPVLLEAAAATVEQESSGASNLFVNGKRSSQDKEST